MYKKIKRIVIKYIPVARAIIELLVLIFAVTAVFYPESTSRIEIIGLALIVAVDCFTNLTEYITERLKAGIEKKLLTTDKKTVKNMDFRKLRKDLTLVTNTIREIKGTRELSLAITSCEKASMWTGKVMQYGTSSISPYAKHDGNRKSVDDIEAKFDETSDILFDSEVFESGTIVVIDNLREFLSDQINLFLSSGMEIEGDFDEITSDHLSLSFMNVYSYMVETRMYLGAEIGSIRDKEKSGKQ